MARIRRVIRKLKPTHDQAFDDQLWPVNLACFVLAGFLAGIILVKTPGHAGPLMWFRWLLLTSLLVLTALLLQLLRRMDGRIVRRRMQLSLVLSLLAHVVLLILIATWSVSSVTTEMADRNKDEPLPPTKIAIPERVVAHVSESEQRKPDFLKPVHTQTPETRKYELTRRIDGPAVMEPKFQPSQVPDIVTRNNPSLTDKNKTVETPSQTADSGSLLSRRIVDAIPRRTQQSGPQNTRAVETVATNERQETTSRQETVNSQKTEFRRDTEGKVAVERSDDVPRSISDLEMNAELSQMEKRQTALRDDEVAVLATRRDQRDSPRSNRRLAITSRQADVIKLTDKQPSTESSRSGPRERVPEVTEVEQRATLEPMKVALSRATGGQAGVGNTENMATSTPARSGPSQVATASARRARSSQSVPAGPSLQPSQPTSIPLLRAGADRPSSTHLADTVEVAMIFGAETSGHLDATSSAVTKREASDAPHDSITAAVGTAHIDFGPQRIIPKNRMGRSSGGGQPELNFAQPDPNFIRSLKSRKVRDAFVSATALDPPTDGTSQVNGSSQVDDRMAEPRNTPTPLKKQVRSVIPEFQADVASSHTAAEPEWTASQVGQANIKSLRGSHKNNRRSAEDPEPSDTEKFATNSRRTIPRQSPQATTSKVRAPHIAAQRSSETQHPLTPSPLHIAARTSNQADFVIVIPATDGPGGISTVVQPEVGTTPRRAATESELLTAQEARFLLPKHGGKPSVHGTDKVAAPGYSERMSQKQGKQYGGNPGRHGTKTEEAIVLGLAFLAQHQSADGSWSLHHYAVGKPYQDFIADSALHADTAATGLALLAFLGAGYHHRDDRYQDVVRAGIDFLVRNQNPRGDLFVPEDQKSNQNVQLYSHGIATMALCEAYGMTLDAELREPTRRALEFVVESQHPRRGGWRYRAGVGSDTSVTGWMMMALKSGQLAHLEMPQDTWHGIARFLNAASTPQQRSMYAYNPYAPDTDAQRHGRQPSKTMTAVGLLMRLYSGWRRDHPDTVRGAEYLSEHLPSPEDRDTYYWYYATQVMFHMGGSYWDSWNARLHPLLTSSQVREGPLVGSWHPTRPIRDKWANQGGRLYVTTMNLLSLEVAYRHLPIYDDTAN